MGEIIEIGWTSKRGGDDTTGGEPPEGDGMEKRVEVLEKALPDLRERMVRLETRLDSIDKTMATKTDIAELKASISAEFGSQTKWVIGTAVVLAGIAFTAARFIPGG
ncbi:hypothetical protein VLF92_05775 [Pseudomonas chengduensis]